MKVLAISGSPRIGGNTEKLLDKVLEGARSNGASVRKIILNKLIFSPCQECSNAPADGSCIVRDDMQKVYREVAKADVVVVGSPVFFGSVSAQTKMMIDRFQCLWMAKNIFHSVPKTTKKRGVFICVSASGKKEFFENASLVVRNFFATIGASCYKQLFCSGLDEKGAVLKRPDLLRKAFEIGKKLSSKP